MASKRSGDSGAAVVHLPVRGTGGPTARAAAASYLERFDVPGTRKTYRSTLRPFVDHLGPDTPIAALDDPAVSAGVAPWFTERWQTRAAVTWNRHLDVLGAALTFWVEQEWIRPGTPLRALRRRKVAERRDRALSRQEIEQLFGLEVPVREKTLWRMLYETAARIEEVLSLDVQDLDLINRWTRPGAVRRKGGAIDTIVWQTGTARLLPRMLRGRKRGPLFLTERRARVALAAADLDPETGRARLSYRQAAGIFEQSTRALANPGVPAEELEHCTGWTLHQLRHSALTHDAEDGTSTQLLMAKSGHSSVSSLRPYIRISREALSRHQQRTDPHRRRR